MIILSKRNDYFRNVLSHSIKLKWIFFAIIFLHIFSFTIKAQQEIILNDSIKAIKIKKQKDPKKAAIFSAILPGAGQAYNKKYWKIPIVWGGFAGLGYWAASQNKGYRKFKNALIYRTDNNPNTIDEYENVYTVESMKTIRNEYRRQRDLIFIFMTLWYGLNIVDATVDAHLSHFNINDNLSFTIQSETLCLAPKNYNALGFQFIYNIKN